MLVNLVKESFDLMCQMYLNCSYLLGREYAGTSAIMEGIL